MNALLGAAAKALVEFAKDGIQRALTSVGADESSSLPDRLDYHLAEVGTWSREIQIYGMIDPKDTDDATVPLGIDLPRRFSDLRARGTTRQETDLLEDDRHYVVLGDPGSGKTTTLKRLARHLLTVQPEPETDSYQYPVIVRLRELSDDNPGEGAVLHRAIALRLGLDTEKASAADRGRFMIGGVPGSKAVAAVLNETRAVVLLDGMDEAQTGIRQQIRNNIRELRLHLSDAKLIITCRSGDYSENFEGFSLVELCPLHAGQVRLVVERWLGDRAGDFLTAVRALPYADLTDRPLLLAQLMLLYQKSGRLPDRCKDVYGKIVNLLLEHWDKQQEISRRSRYAEFSPDQKAPFLAAIAYQLTYRCRSKVFDTADLVSAYHRVREGFGLPLQEAQLVAQEIESHTGIILETSAGYEFSHLSLQEYLCAEHMVRAPHPELLAQYIRQYPSPLAVCVSLSSEAGDWLANLILKENNWSAFTPSAMAVFLARLLVERPYFQRSATFGLAMLRLIDGHAGHDATRTLLGEFTATEVAKVSIGMAFKLYEMSQHTSGDRVFCYRRSELENNYGFVTPYRLALPFDVVRGVLEIGEPVVFSTWEGKSTVTTVEVLEELRAEATSREGGKKGVLYRPESAN